MLLHSYPLLSGIVVQAPDLDLHLFIIDLGFHGYTAHLRTGATPGVAVASFQNNVRWLNGALAGVLIKALRQVP